MFDITFSGLNVGRFINKTVKSGVSFYRIYRCGKTCTVTVNSRDKLKVVALLNDMCYNIENISPRGKTKAKSFVAEHFALVVVTLVSFVAFLLLQNLCLQVNVSGDFDKTTVCQALEECGVSKYGLFPSAIGKLEDSLCVKLGASYVTVNRRGNVINVSAVKRTTSERVSLTTSHDVVSTADGTVTSILVEQGTPLVSVGDKVKKGDVLIRGKRTFNDGNSVDVCAIGKVTLEVGVQSTVQFDGYTTVTVDTGKTYKAVTVKIFKAESSTKVPFESFREETSVANLSGITVTLRTFFETQTKQIETTFALQEQNLKNQALLSATEKADFTITETTFLVTESSVTAVVKGIVTVT